MPEILNPDWAVLLQPSEALEPVKRNVSTTQTCSALSVFSLVILKQKFNVLGKDLVSNEEFNDKMDMRPIRGHSLQTVSLALAERLEMDSFILASAHNICLPLKLTNDEHSMSSLIKLIKNLI